MEEDEEPNSTGCTWQAHAATTSSNIDSVSRKSLNDDPTNILAEDLAMEDCKQGYNVTQELSEIDMVTTSCGSLVQGTPDGGFRHSEGLLTLVQVVRVPLLPHMDADDVADVLYDTVLAKIVKSQTWMKETCTLPHDFIIFCWLPPVGAYRQCLEQSESLVWTEALISNVHAGGWPFSLKLKVPADPSMIFPQQFGFRNYKRGKVNYFDDLSYFIDPVDFEEDDEPMMWYLFDEGADYEDLDHDAHVESPISETVDVSALIAWAIRVLEERAREHMIGRQVSSSYDSDGHKTGSFNVDCKQIMYQQVSMWRMPTCVPPCPRERESGEAAGRIQGLPWWDVGGKPLRCVEPGDVGRGVPRHFEDPRACSDLEYKQRPLTLDTKRRASHPRGEFSLKSLLRTWLWITDAAVSLRRVITSRKHCDDWLRLIVKINASTSSCMASS